jgi:MinD-like ATPase involved in chromosome partitioning or flagellar assembly
MAATGIEQIAGDLRRAGEDGRRVAVIGVARNVGTTYAAITLARALMKEANVVLVDLALAAPNLSVLSTDPDAPGLAELAHGVASFGDIITRDQFSTLHLVAAGNVGEEDHSALANSPMLTTAIEALAHGYGHVVIDAGSMDDMAVARIAALAHRAVLVAGDPAGPAARACAERLSQAGFTEIALLAGGAQAAAA